MSEQVCLGWQVSMTVSACVLDGRSRLAMPSTTASTPSTPPPRLIPLDASCLLPSTLPTLYGALAPFGYLRICTHA